VRVYATSCCFVSFVIHVTYSPHFNFTNMKKPKIRIDFSKLRDSELSDFATGIVTRMMGNANFVTPAPTLVSITTIITNFDKARDKAASGSPADTSAKNVLRDSLEFNLASLGVYVQLTANGDATKMLSSGFQLHKQPSAIGDLPAPEMFKITVDNDAPGKAVLEQSVQEGVEYYLWLYHQDPMPADDAEWSYHISKAHKLDVSGLASGTKYWFKGAGVSTTGNATYSNPASRFVQ
jgi:hypothetical protein